MLKHRNRKGHLKKKVRKNIHFNGASIQLNIFQFIQYKKFKRLFLTQNVYFKHVKLVKRMYLASFYCTAISFNFQKILKNFYLKRVKQIFVPPNYRYRPRFKKQFKSSMIHCACRNTAKNMYSIHKSKEMIGTTILKLLALAIFAQQNHLKMENKCTLTNLMVVNLSLQFFFSKM